MSFLLKIVEGPNKGAEVALVEGVAVTLGKGDDCDIVLVDQTMPDAPLRIEASAEGVVVDGEPVEQLAVRTVGATSFAVGPAEAAWGALKWPKPADADVAAQEEKQETAKTPATGKNDESGAEEAEKKRSGGCGCLVAVIAVLLVIVGMAMAWFHRDRLRESDRIRQFEKIGRGWYSRLAAMSASSVDPGQCAVVSLSDIAGKYGLSLVETNGNARISGNLRTRRDRLVATAEVYQAHPGVELDISDDESFRASSEDALFTLSEGALKVVSATNRVLSIAGTLPSPQSLKNVLEALNSDLPKLRAVDVSNVVLCGTPAEKIESPIASRRSSVKKDFSLSPICGILTSPYPCLVMRDGRRIMEGATIGDRVIVEIGADSVTFTNSTGRFTWKP